MGDVIDDDGGGGATVVHGRQRVVPLLTRSVPDLKLDVLLRDGLGEEGGADGGLLPAGSRGEYPLRTWCVGGAWQLAEELGYRG